jgi:hypothetical protein
VGRWVSREGPTGEEVRWVVVRAATLLLGRPSQLQQAGPTKQLSAARAAAPTLLDVVVGQGAAVLQLLAGEDQALLVRGDACGGESGREGEWRVGRRPRAGRTPARRVASRPMHSAGRCRGPPTLLVLDLGLDILDGVTGLHLQGDGLAREGLDEDLRGRGGRQKWAGSGFGCARAQATDTPAPAGPPDPAWAAPGTGWAAGRGSCARWRGVQAGGKLASRYVACRLPGSPPAPLSGRSL